jgi:TonB-dependent receptor
MISTPLPRPKTTGLRRILRCAAALFAGALLVPCHSSAQENSATGTIEGRVFNAVTDRYLNNARVTVLETGAQQMTDSFGQYRFVNLPAGQFTVRVLYTGMESLEQRVAVTAGQATPQNFNLSSAEGKGSAAAVQLEKYVVSSGRETNGAAIAINEQRFASNLKNVVSTAEFGENPPGDFDIVEFMKFIPGADGQRIRGMPESMTPISIDGNRVASATNSSDTRSVSMDHLMLNNVARIEVTKGPTPDTPAAAMGGSINFVSRSAFERARPELSYRSSINWVAGDAFTLRKTPGPFAQPSAKVTPAVDVAWIVPVNNKFGFTASATYVESPWRQDQQTYEWVPNGGIPGGFTPATPDKPYLRTWQTRDSPRIAKRTGGAITLDYKLSPYDVISVGATYTQKRLTADFHPVTFNVGPTIASYSPTHTYGAAANGSVEVGGNVDTANGAGFNFNLSYRHNGPVWKFDTVASFSHDKNEFPDADKSGVMSGMTMRISDALVRFDNIRRKDQWPHRGADVSVFDAAGKPVDYYNLNNYKIINASNNPRRATDQYRMARSSLGRELNAIIPLKVKVGAEVRENIRDVERPGRTYNFVGADRVANSADDSAGFLLDELFSTRVSPYGFPQLFQYPSPVKMASLFRTRPEYFTIDARTPWRNEVNNSKWMRETVSAAYLRMDADFFKNRWRLVGGVRYEHTEDQGFGPLVDPRRVPKGTTDPILIDRATYVRRGASSTVKYGDFYPSLNSTFDVRENLILRFGYARTISRPDLSAILPGAIVPDPESSSRIITINNTTLKPWQADNLDLTLEYYFPRTGVASVGVFRKDIDDFFGAVTTDANPALLEPYGIDTAIYNSTNGYLVQTQLNAGSAKVSGMELSYKQNLNFLPEWASGLQFHGTFTQFQLDGLKSAALTAFFTPRTYTMGLILTKRRFNLSANVTSVARHRYFLVTGAGVPADTYNEFYGPQVYTASGAFVLTKRWQLFFSAKNIGSRGFYNKRYGPLTPDYAKFRNQTKSPANFAIGIKGSL